jgi:hypothetical protein
MAAASTVCPLLKRVRLIGSDARLIPPSIGIEQLFIATNFPLARCGGMTGKQSEAATAAQTELAMSAGKLEDSAQQQTDSADRRTELAADRTVLAPVSFAALIGIWTA